MGFSTHLFVSWKLSEENNLSIRFFANPFLFFHLSTEFAVSAVKITSLKVPSTYLLDKSSKNPDPLILDCEYEVDESEKGFVLKWFLDGQPVYQWIPSKNPFPFVSSCWNSRPFFGKYKHTHTHTHGSN